MNTERDALVADMLARRVPHSEIIAEMRRLGYGEMTADAIKGVGGRARRAGTLEPRPRGRPWPQRAERTPDAPRQITPEQTVDYSRTGGKHVKGKHGAEEAFEGRNARALELRRGGMSAAETANQLRQEGYPTTTRSAVLQVWHRENKRAPAAPESDAAAAARLGMSEARYKALSARKATADAFAPLAVAGGGAAGALGLEYLFGGEAQAQDAEQNVDEEPFTGRLGTPPYYQPEERFLEEAPYNDYPPPDGPNPEVADYPEQSSMPPVNAGQQDASLWAPALGALAGAALARGRARAIFAPRVAAEEARMLSGPVRELPLGTKRVADLQAVQDAYGVLGGAAGGGVGATLGSLATPQAQDADPWALAYPAAGMALGAAGAGALNAFSPLRRAAQTEAKWALDRAWNGGDVLGPPRAHPRSLTRGGDPILEMEQVAEPGGARWQMRDGELSADWDFDRPMPAPGELKRLERPPESAAGPMLDYMPGGVGGRDIEMARPVLPPPTPPAPPELPPPPKRSSRRRPIDELKTGSRIGKASDQVALADEHVPEWREGGKPTGKRAFEALKGKMAQDPAFKDWMRETYPAIFAAIVGGGALAASDDADAFSPTR